MFLPSFRHLIEIEALKTQNQNDLERISSEHKRISDLEQKRQNRRQEILDLDEENRGLKLIEKQLEIESLEQKNKRLKEQMDMISNEKELKALETQLAALAEDLTHKEETYFATLERSESIAEEKKTAEEFLAGSVQSLEEIKKEVENESKKYQQQIDNRMLRVHSLEEQVDPKLRGFYGELEKKFHPVRPVAYLIDKKCSQCHMQVDSIFKASIEEGRSFETCPNCGRLLIPETAKIY